MPKTPVGARILEQLAALNDQLCFFLMLEYQLTEQLVGFSSALGNAFTSDVFARNPYAPRIHVPLKLLPTFQRENRQFTFGAYAATSYEVASSFFEGADALLAAAFGPTLKRAKGVKGGPEDHFRSMIVANGFSAPPRPVLETFTYLRHRRNAFIHRSTVVPPVFLSATASNGAALNAAWGGTAKPIDFAVANIGPLAEDETIAALKLLRIAIQELDEHLAGVLGSSSIARLVALELFGSLKTRPNADVIAKRVKKIVAVAEHEYGIICPDADATHAATTIGVR